VSGYVVLRLPLPDGVVTWFVTGSRTSPRTVSRRTAFTSTTKSTVWSRWSLIATSATVSRRTTGASASSHDYLNVAAIDQTCRILRLPTI